MATIPPSTQEQSESAFMIPTCVVCLDSLSWSNPDLYPCNLACGHSDLHILCAQKLVTSNKIKCPQCNASTYCNGDSDLPANITLRSLLEEYEKSLSINKTDVESLMSVSLSSPSVPSTIANTSTIGHVCQNLDDDCSSVATVYCPKCDVCLCEGCGTSTHQNQFMKSHQFVPLQQRIPKCGKHPHCFLNRICFQEKTLICSECHLETHNGHDVRKLEEVASSIRTNLEKKVHTVSKMETVLNGHKKDAIQHTQEFVTSVNASILEVDRRFDILYANLAQQQQEIKDMMLAAEEDQRNQSNSTQHSICKTQYQISSMLNDFNEKVPNDVDLVTASSTIELQLKAMEKDIHDVIEDQPPFRTFEFASGSPSFEELICSFDQTKQNCLSEKKNQLKALAINGTIDGEGALLVRSREGNEEEVKLLLDYGVDKNIVDKDGNSALILATRNGHKACTRLLIDAGVDKDIMNKRGNSALIFASSNGDKECIRLLINAGADINIVNRDGNSALIFAVRQSDKKSTRLLIDYGADKNIVNKHGNSALCFATTNGDEECIRLLVNAGADIDTLNFNTSGDEECTWPLIDAGADQDIMEYGDLGMYFLDKIRTKKDQTDCVALLETSSGNILRSFPLP